MFVFFFSILQTYFFESRTSKLKVSLPFLQHPWAAELIICGMWRGYKIGPDWEFTEPEEWKLLWKSNTINCEVFQHFSASLSPSQSPFPSCSSQTTLTATTSGPQPSFLSFLIFSTVFQTILLLHFCLPFSALPFIFL